MDIGTAKPSKEEQKLVPHWGLDLVEPGQRFTAADFKKYAEQKIAEIRARGKVPLLAGGTGLYIDSVIFDYQFGGEINTTPVSYTHLDVYKRQVQLDFVQPERFGLEYAGMEGSAERPVMIHCALLGSIERFLSVFIEHTGGWFPFWIAPEQVRILTINDQVLPYVDEIKTVLTDTVLMKPVKYNEVRFTTDDRNESLGKKIREATAWKIPVQLIVGPKDVEACEVSVRTQGGEEKVALDQLSEYLKMCIRDSY